MNIWLSYVSFPITTAVYFERAFRKMSNVITVGPSVDEGLFDTWNLSALKGKVKSQDIPASYSPDISSLVQKAGKSNYPDLFLWIESVPNHMPVNFSSLECPKAALLIDTHINLKHHLEIARHFEYVFLVHRQFIPEFHKNGIFNVHWLPVACDPEMHFKADRQKLYDVGFVGTVDGPLQQRRRELLNKLGSNMKVHYKRCFLEEMAVFFSESKIVFNNSILNDLNMRLFEVLSTGSFLLTDMAADSGQAEMFRSGEDLCVYNDENIVELAEYYLKNPEQREKIADRGRKTVHKAHTYLHRAEEIIKVCSGIAKDTPSAEEWRELSEHNDSRKWFQMPDSGIRYKLNEKDDFLGGIKTDMTRSFVIPVLDMSPASPYNIVKLLEDLSDVQGNVIIIFNSVEMAEKLKNHPRIDYYAVMNENVGVARAWNIGLNVSETPVTFILNSDLHVEREAVDEMEKYLLELDSAAIVGPQGSFFKFETAKDLHYFDKGSFNYPVAVDAVSGFFFAVKTEYFNGGSLHFENNFTPCYFEEWDLGLQIKRAGLKSYVVPVTGYDHEWSGSIRALRTIKYMKKEETAGEIHQRNLGIFKEKWEKIRNTDNKCRDIFTSCFVQFYEEKAEKLISMKMFDKAKDFYQNILSIYPGNLNSLEALAGIEYRSGNLTAALELYNRISEIDPEYQIGVSDLPEGSSPVTSVSDLNETELNSAVQDYYENPRPDIQRTVNQASRTLLDVGCGAGLMAFELKHKLNAEVWGIEYNPAAAQKASLRIDKVFTGRVEDNIPKLPDNYFDTIIFADVLEHLMDPALVIRNLKRKLADNGELIASIPNVRFWGVISNLISGHWEYEDAGILDRTHLKFFTRSSIMNMFSGAGYRIVNMYSNRVDIPDLSPALLSALTAEGINVDTLNSETKDFQYIIRAVKA